MHQYSTLVTTAIVRELILAVVRERILDPRRSSFLQVISNLVIRSPNPMSILNPPYHSVHSDRHHNRSTAEASPGTLPKHSYPEGRAEGPLGPLLGLRCAPPPRQAAAAHLPPPSKSPGAPSRCCQRTLKPSDSRTCKPDSIAEALQLPLQLQLQLICRGTIEMLSENPENSETLR